MARTHVVVDGSNIATEGRTLPSLQQLDEAVRAFLAERPHDICTVVVDATFEHRIAASEKAMYDEALAANELLTPPAGTTGRGDKFILEIAERADATVFSNDSFQEFHGDYDWLFEPGRLIGGKPVPGVGWVFVERTPVRGPKSRMATRAANKKRTRGAAASSAKKVAHSSPAKGVDPGPMPTPKSPPPRKRAKAADPAKAAPAARAAPAPESSARAGGDALNAPLPFIEFVAEHQPGSTVTGTVVEFSSHGAYVDVDGVRCYAPLRLLGSPAPRSAREVLARGEAREFVVAAIHAARRGIDLGIPGLVPVGSDVKATTKRSSSRRRSRTGTTVTEASTDANADADQVPAAAGTDQPESEATLAPTKRAAAKKAPAKKATARKATARKAPARKAPAKRTTARKTTARKAPARKTTAKKATARKATARKAPARKATAKKATARKATAKKATARKAPAKKAVARKAPARKTTARKAPAKKKAVARKAPARKTTARKTTARKATARKAPAKKATARKAPARKSTARKAPARKAPARRTTARKR
jgi:hypothetical protein